MINFKFLAGLTVFLFNACIGTIGKNICFDCQNLKSCVGPGTYTFHADDEIAIEHVPNNNTVQSALEHCLPHDYRIIGSVGYYLCFHKPFCRIIVGTHSTTKQVISYCNSCGKDCKCHGPPLRDKKKNKCWECSNLKKCVGPGTVYASPTDEWAIEYHGDNKSYHPNMKHCIPPGYEIKDSVKDYICFHKPFCRLVVGYYSKTRKVQKYCAYCAERCKCSGNSDVLSSRAHLFFYLGIYVNYLL